MKNIDWLQVLKCLFLLIIGGIVAFIGQPLIHGNDTAINVVVTIFSILAGFLVAILAMVGDPLLLPLGSWRSAELSREKIDKKLTRHKILFELYLYSLAFIFAALLTRLSNPNLTIWFERIFLFFSTIAFIVSFRLPKILMDSQRQRIDAIIKERRKNSGIEE
jgi:hypothetical protein